MDVCHWCNGAGPCEQCHDTGVHNGRRQVPSGNLSVGGRLTHGGVNLYPPELPDPQVDDLESLPGDAPEAPRNGSTRRWRVLRQQVIDEEETCWLCDEDVDKTLQHPHPMQASVDHVVGLAQGGEEFDRDNLRLAHMACNIKKAHSDHEREGERAKAPKPMSEVRRALPGAVASGNPVTALAALRDLLATQLAECESARDVAALSTQLTNVLKALDRDEAPATEGTGLDELAAARAARGAEPPRTARPSRG